MDEIELAAKRAWHAAVDEASGWNPFDQWDDAFTDGFAEGVKWAREQA